MISLNQSYLFCTSDMGREISIFCGYKHFVKSEESNTEGGEEAKLFDVIEEVEEKPISTPL